MRILPIASGKGGVGKTTLALNLALTLARSQRTVLVDLDTGTSSLRNFIAAPVERDLFHFLKKGSPLDACRQFLPPSMDPERAFANFSFIAAPGGFIHDIVNMDAASKARLVEGVNALQADYVVIDLKAGLDAGVLDFLPISNSGILLFTPGQRAATLAAAQTAKAVLFRMLNLMADAPLARERLFPANAPQAPLLQRLRDFLRNGRDPEGKNLDDFIRAAEAEFPQENFFRVFRYYVENYRVYYILNRFNSIAESLENTIQPFVTDMFRTVSARVSFHNLGWVVEHDDVRQAAESGVPYPVRRHYQEKRAPAPARDSDAFLRSMCGLAAKPQKPERAHGVSDELRDQVDLLRKIYVCNAGNDPLTNLGFIAARIREFSANSNHQFGMKHIYSAGEFVERFQARIV
jgi:MinD-like ATPase involved in chromosome partitioning or flagellar assembly